MTQQSIYLGASPDDHTGDKLRDGGAKINDNFTELYDLLRVGNGNPNGNVTASPGRLYLQLDTPKLWQKKVGSDANGWILVGATVNRIEMFTKIVGVGDGDAILFTDLVGYSRGWGNYAGGNIGLWVAPAGLISTYTFRRLDNRRCIQLRPGATQTQGASVAMMFKPAGLNTSFPFSMDFFADAFPAIAGTITPDDRLQAPAWSIAAWLRKQGAPSLTGCQQCFGFMTTPTTYPEAEVPRAGLLGDGVTGFLFGSVNCPDGAASGNNAPSDRNINSVQPAELVDPGTNWFHVRIKFIPPTPTQSGRWGAYLNGKLVATFTAVTNFPRGSATVNDNYCYNIPVITAYGYSQQLDGLEVHDLRVIVEDDWTL